MSKYTDDELRDLQMAFRCVFPYTYWFECELEDFKRYTHLDTFNSSGGTIGRVLNLSLDDMPLLINAHKHGDSIAGVYAEIVAKWRFKLGR